MRGRFRTPSGVCKVRWCPDSTPACCRTSRVSLSRRRQPRPLPARTERRRRCRAAARPPSWCCCDTAWRDLWPSRRAWPEGQSAGCQGAPAATATSPTQLRTPAGSEGWTLRSRGGHSNRSPSTCACVCRWKVKGHWPILGRMSSVAPLKKQMWMTIPRSIWWTETSDQRLAEPSAFLLLIWLSIQKPDIKEPTSWNISTSSGKPHDTVFHREAFMGGFCCSDHARTRDQLVCMYGAVRRETDLEKTTEPSLLNEGSSKHFGLQQGMRWSWDSWARSRTGLPWPSPRRSVWRITLNATIMTRIFDLLPEQTQPRSAPLLVSPGAWHANTAAGPSGPQEPGPSLTLRW